MFPWNIAKSAEAMFSRWAVKRVCKFLLKKKLGHFILGDIDLDQLDVQLTNGTLQLCDLALNVDYLNDKLGEAASLVIKEGSIGSLLVKMPWKGKGCEVEVDELELVLAPLARDKSTAEDESCSTSQDNDNGINHDLRKLQHEMVDNPVSSASLDVHEGVKTIAKMVKWFLTSFHIRIKNLIVAYDPSSEKDERKMGGHTTLVLRIPEIECGTCVSEDANLNYRGRFESLLGISQLTNFVKFQGAVLELLQMDDIDNQASSPSISGITYGESISDSCPSNATIPILTGGKGGFSGNMRLSIPWKDGSLDIRKVDADVHIDPVELRLQPNTIKWFLLSWETYKNLDNDSRSHMHYKPTDSVDFNSMSSTLGSSVIATDKVVSERDNYSGNISSLSGQESVTEDMLPGSHLISDWVPVDFNKDKRNGIGEELDFGASVDQFFECFDEMRNSQSALGSSGMWNWTCSVFSAITAASNLASGSLHIPSEQQHAETNLKATIAGISIVFCFHDKNHKHFCEMKGDQNCGGAQVHYLGAEFGNMVLSLQVCPRDVKFVGTVKYIEVTDYLRDENDAMDFGLGTFSDNIHHLNLFMESLQAEVQSALPTFASSAEDPDLFNSKELDAVDFPFGEAVKIPLLRTSGVTHCQFIVNSSSADGSLTGPTSFSLKLPPFLLWVNFQLIDLLLNLLKEVGKCVDMNKFPSEALSKKHVSSRESTKRGSGLRVRALSPSESLQGNIVVPDARVILCFPFESDENLRGYSLWDQFIALDFSSPSTLNKEITQDANPVSDVKLQERHSSTATRSLHFNIGNPDIYLVTSASRDGFETNSRGLNRQKFFAQNVLSAASRMDGLSLSMLWQEGPVTGPWIAKRAKALATSKESKSSRKFVGKDYEFASVTSTKDLEDLYMRSRQEMILSSAFFIHVNISPVSINLGCSQYISLHCLLDQIINGFARGSHYAVDLREESCLSQASILVECDSVEILINLNAKENIKSSIQSELPGSWHYLKLKVKKFELLSVSNIGGIRDASFFWLAHGEGKLCGSITGVSDELLISSSNSTMNRGDGEGVNASSSRLAGSDIVHLWDPESTHAFTSVTIRGGTIVAVGGRLDWLDEIISFFSLPPAEVDQAAYSSSQKGGPSASGGASFNLNLVDIGLSYEPRFKNLAVSNVVIDSKYGSSNTKEDMHEQYIGCLLAASSLNLTNTAIVDSVENDYKIGVQDLGLLICAVSEPENLGGTYSIDYLRRVGFVKVARLAHMEAIFRDNGKSGLLWELELSKSHIELETCHDTTSGLIRLIAQLQQFFAPDLEETLLHLQTRWNNSQQAQERDNFYDETGNFSTGASPATSQVSTCVDMESTLGVVGLMDEICEDAFHVVGMQNWQSDSSEPELHMLLDEALLGESYLSIDTPEVFSPELSFNGSVPAIESEDIQTSFDQKGCYSELIEGYCLSELGPLSETLSGKLPPCKSRNVGTGDLGRKDSGWYGDSSLRIVENHIPEMIKPSLKQFVEGKLPSNGRVLIKNVNVRWRMYAGSDWRKTTKNGEHSINVRGRDSDVCLELALSGMEFKYEVFPVGSICASKLSLSVKDFHLYDKSKDAPWKLVLGYYLSRDHPRESSSKGIKLDLEAVRPDPLSPLEEYRLRIALLPILLHLHQSHLDFLISFFGPKSLPADQCPGHHQDSCGSVLSATKNNIAEEALLPYFQKFDIWPVLVRVDYSPRHVDLVALGGGKYVELVNLVPWKGVELQLKHVHAVGIYGWSSVCETIIGEWLEDISQNQIHKVLKGLPTIRSLVAVGTGAAKLVTLPVESYRRDGRLLKGMQRGTIAFLRSISLEAIGLGVHLAAGAHDILLQAEYILATVPPSVPSALQARTKANIRSNQPKDAQQGLQQAYESLSDGLGKTASALVRTPLKRYQRGASVGSALATAVRAVPAAAIAPASACMSAAHYALLGFRNSLDPERKKESMEKYLGPSQPQE